MPPDTLQDAGDQANAEPPANSKPRKPRRDPEIRRKYMARLMRKRRADERAAAAKANAVAAGVTVQTGAIARNHRTTILQRVAAGDMLQDIGKMYACTPSAISGMLAADPEYRAARERGAEVRLHAAFCRVRECGDTAQDADGNTIFPLAKLASAREAEFRSAAWFGEREFPERWGRQDRLLVDKLDLRGTLIEARRRAQVEDAEVVQPADPPAE